MPVEKHHFHPTILREYDIRGIVGETLFPADAEAIGRAFGSQMIENGDQRVAVGYDGRASSPELEQALVRGLRASGVDVIRIGMGPTPMLYFATYELETRNGIMITGSHNPPSHNGFKMVQMGKPFFGAHIQALGQRAASGQFTDGEGAVSDDPVMDRYVARMLQDFQNPSDLSIVWDCGNGVTGEAVRKTVSKLPGRHVLLYDEIDSSFPNHHPDPTVEENLQDLIRTVKGIGADLGIAFDGDGDRIGVVDSRGNIIWGDQLLGILSREVLAANPNAPIIADVKASKVLFDEIANLGGAPVMWKTGHSLIKTRMAELQAPLAGEMSGHIFYNDTYYGYDDALYVGLRLLNFLGSQDKTIDDLLDALPRMINTPEMRFPCPDEEKFDAVDRITAILKDAGADFSDIDGVRVTSGGGWWLLRASNTQAVLVARCEARHDEELESVKADMLDYLSRANIDCPAL
ncbi:phosphoglucomutase/phosphomannomutase PgmG [Sneathiella chinensis]|uniref:Phosphomannomutase n=1 Tax=Sneathiella chinensis TaxID=349750 RepID=A0ABQ5U7D8_9PROT|nr:phosphomannomutase/phosphoglucomutase [Sneathiella chinensis]GLQ07711.1 phosphomannomutase [Sneathiella chinensis]